MLSTNDAWQIPRLGVNVSDNATRCDGSVFRVLYFYSDGVKLKTRPIEQSVLERKRQEVEEQRIRKAAADLEEPLWSWESMQID